MSFRLLSAGLYVMGLSVTCADELPPANQRLVTSSTQAGSQHEGVLVSIHTTDDRTLTGYLQPQPGADLVELLSERQGIVLRTTIPVSSILKMTPCRQPEVLRWQRDRQEPATVPRVSPEHRRLHGAVPRPEHHNRQRKSHVPIQTLCVDAWTDNLDGDPPLDGIRMLVAPVSSAGELVAADGTLTVELVVRRSQTHRRYDSVRDTFEVAERWSRQVSQNDFGPHGTVISLPFRRLDPVTDLGPVPVGLLKVKLGVSGHGLYEAAEIEVGLRPPSYFRDELQLFTGNREFRLGDFRRRQSGP